MDKKEICPECNGKNIERSKNDLGHIKAHGIRPSRMYAYICLDCGYVRTYAELVKK